MLKLKVDPIFTPGMGGYIITGSVSEEGATLTWWLEGDIKNRSSDGFVITGNEWELSVILSGNVNQIYIQATKADDLSAVSSINLNTSTKSEVPSFQYNEFDELAFSKGIDRILLETNDSLRQRALDASINPGSSTLVGLSLGIERELSLPHMDRFFNLSIRFDPRVNDVYKRVYLNLGKHRAAVQLDEYINTRELLDIDPAYNNAYTKKSIGLGGLDGDNKLRIYNGTQEIPEELYTLKGENEIQFQVDSSLDLDNKMYITYPYQEYFDYLKEDLTHATVEDLRTWLRTLETVQDEDGNTKPLINWNDGYYAPSGEEPTLYESRDTLEFAINDPPTTSSFVKIEEDTGTVFLEYVEDYSDKSLFNCSQILDIHSYVLNKDPVNLRGSWITIEELHSKDFIDSLNRRGSLKDYENIEFYAKELQRAVRQGIHRTTVNRDRWGSDSPFYIGEASVTSKFDGGLQKFTILNNSGNNSNREEISLNTRHYFARLLSTQA